MKFAMVHLPNDDAATRVGYETAIDALPPLPRMVFLLRRVDELSYGAIALRLAIGVQAVESALAEAIYQICCTLNGEAPKRAMPEPLANADALLSERHRLYCEQRLYALGVTLPAAWNVEGRADNEAAVMLAMLLSMPLEVLQTFVLSQIENLTHAQIALRLKISRRIVRKMLRRGVRHIAHRPASFEHWLALRCYGCRRPPACVSTPGLRLDRTDTTATVQSGRRTVFGHVVAQDR